LTGAGAVLGTADYIAPEQVRDAHLADGRSDIYSLGCTLYHLLAGRPPFPKGSAREKLLLHTTDTPPSLHELRPEIPEGLARVVAKMMAKLPEYRYQTAEEVASALGAFALGKDRAAGRRRARWEIAGLLFAVILSVASAGWWMRTHSGDGERATQRIEANSAQQLPSGNVGELCRWKGHGKIPVFRIVMASDGRSAWSVADDFRRWDVATGTTIQRVVPSLRLEELLPTRDGKQFLTMEQRGGLIRLYDTASMEEVRSFDRGPPKAWQAAWFPDGSRFLTDGEDGIVRIWDLNAGVPLHEFPSLGGISCVAVNPDGNQFLTGSEVDRKLSVRDLRTKRVQFEILEQVCHPHSVHFVLEGKAILSCGCDDSIRLFDAQTGDVMKVFKTSNKSTHWARIALFQDGRHFVSADSHEFLRLWSIDSERELYSARTELGGAASLAVTPDGRHVLIGTFHGDIVQWRLPDLPRG
jgi:hypothetical protein